MLLPTTSHVFLSYPTSHLLAVESIALRLRGDARVSFWFAPWNQVPGRPMQEQLEDALLGAQACAVFIGGDDAAIAGWQAEEMRTAIQKRVEDAPDYRIIPVLLPGVARPDLKALPAFLRLYGMVEFKSLDDDNAFRQLLAGILGVPPIEVEECLQAEPAKERSEVPASGRFDGGHALVIGVANYPNVRALPSAILRDAQDVAALLVDPERCGYPADHVTLLTDDQATGAGIRTALADLAGRTGPDDTAVVYFSGHGAHEGEGAEGREYILPFDSDADDLASTAITGAEMTALLGAVPAARLLVLFDSCHSGGAAEPKSAKGAALPAPGLTPAYCEALAQGKGRIVMTSSDADESSWVLPGGTNSLFTTYLLEALRGDARTLGDGYVRAFDIFRHVSENVPKHAPGAQHPLFKAAMREDFPVAIISR